MKFKCPQCGETAIGGFSKFKSHETSPAVCSSCGKFSCEPSWHSMFSSLFWGIGIFVMLGFAIFHQSWMPLIIPFIIWVLLEIYLFIALPLRPIAEATVKKARWELYIFLGVLLLLVLAAGVYENVNH